MSRKRLGCMRRERLGWISRESIGSMRRKRLGCMSRGRLPAGTGGVAWGALAGTNTRARARTHTHTHTQHAHDGSQHTAPCTTRISEQAFADARAVGVIAAVAAGNEYLADALSSPAW